jgi:hypothetical protein
MSFLCSVDFIDVECDFDTSALYEIVLLYKFLLFPSSFKIKTTGGISKVVIVNSEHENIDSLDIICFYHHPLSRIATLTRKSSEQEIRKAYVDDVTGALTNIGKQYNWDITRIQELKREIERRNYKFYGAFGAYKSSPDRSNKAQLVWATDDYINFSVDVKNAKNDHKISIPVVSITIMLGLFQTICKKFFWENHNTIRIIQENMRDYWDVDITQGTSTFHYPRAEKGDPHGQYDFAKMYIDGRYVEHNMEEAVMWLERSAKQGFKRAIRLLERIKSGETNLADPLMSTRRPPSQQPSGSQAKGQKGIYDYELEVLDQKRKLR